MRAADRAEHRNQGREHRHRRAGIGQQRDGDMFPLGQALGHDPGANDGRGEQQRAEAFGEQPAHSAHGLSVRDLPIASRRS